ncbi:MAG TPA: uroporphyrinogen decarboxylase family protein [bacterium]|nr:uroporphyrinogen decarboxylase family protein [bacterium]
MRDPALFFQPAVYEHAAAVIHRTPWEVSRNEDLLYQAHAAAYELYHHTPVTVGIDIYNPEAEAYGAQVTPTEGFGIPTITVPLFHDPTQLLELEPFDPNTAGRIGMLIRVGQRLKARFPEADVRIPVSGPFSMASVLLGFETLLYAALVKADLLAQGLQRLAVYQRGFLQAIQDAGLKVTLFESAATPPLISPDIFTQIELPALSQLVALAGRIQGFTPALIIGGDTALLVNELCSTGATYLICPAETDQQQFLDKAKAHPEVMIRINMISRIVSEGTREEIAGEVRRMLALAAQREKVCIGTGVLPYETPKENVFYISELLQQNG